MTHLAIKILKGLAIFIVFVLLSLTIFCAATIIIMDFTALNANFYQNQLDKNNAYGIISDFLVEQLSQMAAGNQTSNNAPDTNSQIPAVDEGLKQQLKIALSPEKLKAQIEPQITNLFDYLNSKTDTLTISFDLREFKALMAEYYRQQGINVSQTMNKIPDIYAISQTGTGAGVYAQLTSARAIISVIHTVFYILLILITFFLFLLYLLYRPNWKKFMSQTGTNILIDGIFSLIAFMIIKTALLSQIAGGLPPQVSGLVVGFVTGFIDTAVIAFIIITAIGLGILIGSFFVKTTGETVKEEKQKPKQEDKNPNKRKTKTRTKQTGTK